MAQSYRARVNVLPARSVASSTPDGQRPPTPLIAAPPKQRVRFALELADVEQLEKRRTIDDVRTQRVTVNNEYLSVRMLFPEPVNHLRHDCGELRPSLSTPGEELASSAAPSSSGHVC
jgi:hypothetical protein